MNPSNRLEIDRRCAMAAMLMPLVAPAGAAERAAGDAKPIAVGNQLQLFLDRDLIASMKDTELRLHEPTRAEVVLRRDRPYEDTAMFDPVVIKDGDRYRLWYRANFNALPYYMAYAESADGVRWTKRNLGLVEVNGSKDNNVVWTSRDHASPHVWSLFKDPNPGVPAGELYKAVGRVVIGGKEGLTMLVSPDGLRWRLLDADRPLALTGGAFDTHSICLWDGARRQYAVYTRGFKGGVRLIRRSVSKDFRTWGPLEYIDTGDAPVEHLYKNAAVPYYRRPDLILMFPKRFLPDRRSLDPKEKNRGLSDVVFMSSRDGFRFQRFREAFVRPGPDLDNWHHRAIEVGPTLVPTGQGEMSLYMFEHYYRPNVHLRRLVLREDGFVSVHARASGGEFTTRPMTFTGKRLVLNMATSAAGSVRVEVQGADGEPIPGHRLADAEELYGDELARPVTWKGQGDLGGLAGRAIRLRFVLHDADVYAMQFS